MGRIAGVTAEETRERVLDGAAAVFARKGYDGATIAEITSEAGVSSGAIYAHFPTKAELFVGTLSAHGENEVDRLLEVGSGKDAGRLLRDRGVGLAHRRPQDGSLLVEAIVAAKRHPEVAALIASKLDEREGRIAELIRAGQQDGSIDGTIRPNAVARFVLMLVLGSVMVAAMDLPTVDEDDWGDLMNDLISRFDARNTTGKA